MDVSKNFFGKLRALSLTLEKEAKQLERALNEEDTDYEEESPVRVLHDLHCEIRTLKEDVNASLGKSSSENQGIRDFMKASETLMQRNAADLGKIRELFQKYGYKPHEEVNSDLMESVQNKSEEEKADDVPHLPASTEKPPVPKDPLRTPQLSDFGLSQYAFSRPWNTAERQHETNALQENSKNKALLKTQSPCILSKTPKCMLKVDNYQCATPKLEHFGISEHTMRMNEDFTMSLICKAAETSKNVLCLILSSPTIPAVRSCFFSSSLLLRRHIQIFTVFTILIKIKKEIIICSSEGDLVLRLVKKDDHEVNVADMTCQKIMVTPGQKLKVTADNADWMASPMVLVFCTPDVKTSRTNSTVSRSPETNELSLPIHIRTPQFPDFETRWLKPGSKVVNGNYLHFHTLFDISSFSNVSLGFFSNTTFSYEKIESVTKNDATDKEHIEESIPSAVSSDEFLRHFEDLSPPKIKLYDQLLSTPPAPEITRIPDDVLQILSKYNHKGDSSKAKVMETKAGNTTKYESDFTEYCNKENR
ncbi:SKA3 protein, partial [Nycticryphes semicollaris]|nr:SKA3 protein [Nycticryphes semicollaris]